MNNFFYNLNDKLNAIRATPEVTHQQLNERDMSRAAKGYEKYGKEGMEALAKAGRDGKALDPVRKKYDKYDNKEVDEGVMDTVKSVGKRVASGVNRLVGHGSDEDMRRDVQRKAGVPQTGKKPEQKTTEAAKYRDPKYKDRLYTQEPPDYTYGPDMDDAYDNPKPDDYAGRKRKIGGGEFPSTDPLASGQGIGRSGIKNSILDRGPRKGMPSRNQISSLKGSIKDASGTHAGPNLPEAAKYRDPKYKDKLYTQKPPEADRDDSEDVYYNRVKPDDYQGAKRLKGGGEYDHNDPLRRGDGIGRSGMKHSINTAGKRKGLPSRDQITSLKSSIKSAHGTHAEPNLPEAGTPMSAKQKSFAKLAPPADKITFADKIAGAKKEVDEMLGDVAAEAMKGAIGRMGTGSHQAKTTMKHISNASPALKKAARDIKPGIAGYRDRADMLRAGGVDEERSKGTAFDMSTKRVDKPKVGSIERGSKHDIKHTATGRMVTRRTDAQGNSVGADDASDTQAGPRGRGRPKGTTGAIGAKGPSGRSKLMTKEGDHDEGEYDQEGDMAKDDIKTIVRHAQALSKVLGDNDNLPEWVQSKLAKIEGMMISIDEYMQNQESDEEEPIAEKAVSKQQQKFMGMAHAMQKGEKVKGASKELKKVASTMKPKDTEDFAKTKHKGLPDKAESKKKEEDVEESTTAGSVATSTATKGGGGMVGKGIYDSMNRELENMIAESMTINMSDSTEGGKSLTITATDEDALKLGMLLKNAGLGSGGAHGGDQHSSGEQPCATCGMPDCGCGDVQEAVDENSPDYPTNTEQANNNFGYAGGLDGPKSTGQSTVPVLASQDERQHSYAAEEEDAIKRMMEMAGLAEGNMPMVKKDGKMVPAFAADGKGKNDLEAKDKDKEEDTVEESIRRMMEIAGVKKKPMDEEKTDEGNKFAFNVLKAKEAGKKEADLDGDGDMEKVRESIFALNNQWQAYKG